MIEMTTIGAPGAVPLRAANATKKDGSRATTTAVHLAAAVPDMIEMTTMAALGGDLLRGANATKKDGS